MDQFSLFHWFILAAIAYGLYRLFSGVMSDGTTMFCQSCGHEGPGEVKTPGTMAIEVILYLFFIIPGLIYSFWRISKRTKVCKKCGSENLIPPDSPVAVAAKKRLSE